MRETVLIVDDHAAYRVAVRLLLEADGFEVVGECRNGEDALAQVVQLQPRVVLLDVQLPGMDGFAVAEHLATFAAVAVILISSRDADAYGGLVAATPCAGFLAKSRLSGAAIRALLACVE